MAHPDDAASLGKIEESIAPGNTACTMLSPLQEEWDFYPQIMERSMAKKYAAIGDAASAKEWIAITYRMHAGMASAANMPASRLS